MASNGHDRECWERMCSTALKYADMGFPVFPLWSVDKSGRCLCGNADCNSPGKHPYGRHVPNGHLDATTDGNTICSWFKDGPLNIGIRTGLESGVVVLDVDYRNGGEESIKKRRISENTPHVKTGGGLHYYFKHPGKHVKSGSDVFGPGLDCKGDGGYVVAPPSMHPCWQEYRWLIDPKAGFPDMPKWMFDGKSKTVAADQQHDDARIPKGERNGTLTSLAGSMRRRGMSERAISAALLEENRRRCSPPLEDAEVEQIATSVAKYAPSNGENVAGTADNGKSKSQATQLVDLAEKAELFHNAEGDAYATIANDGHYETWPMKSKWFRRWLIGQFWKTCKKAPGSQATQDALRVLASKAIYDGPEKLVSVRLAEHDGAIWLDLANSDWQAVKITQDGWVAVSKPPVNFLRPRGLSPLPRPVPGASINLLRQFINLYSEDDWALLVSWIVAALSPQGPYPALVVGGEQGSAKSTLCRLLRAIIDPNSASLRAMPRDGRDLVIAASNSWILAYDNISYVHPWLSDAFCRMATGGGFATRELYSDSEEVIFDVMRPIMLNGICELATRSDLLDRSICITLPTIPDMKRTTEKELWSRFNELLPQILGAFLDAVSIAMKNLPSVKLQNPPRMADFATLAVAAEEGLGLKPGIFLSAYAGNRGQASDLAIEASAIGAVILGLFDDRNYWEGTAQELLTQLEDHQDCSERTKNRRDWPKTPEALGKALRRIAPNLRQAGIDVRFDRGSGKRRRRLIVLEKLDILLSDLSEPSGDTRNKGASKVVSDRLDGSDSNIPPYSCESPCHSVNGARTHD